MIRRVILIFELNGLPGCGKTTLRNEICKKYLSASSVGVADFRGEGKSKTDKMFVRMKRFLIQFTPANLGLYHVLKKMMRNSKTIGSLKVCNPYEKAITVMYIVYLYNAYRKAGDNLLFADEGLVQSLTTCCSQMEIDNSSLEATLQYFKSVSEKIIVINCECNLDTSLQRITERNRNDSAIDQLDSNELLFFLERYEEKLLSTRKAIKKICRQSISLEMEDEDSNLAKKLVVKIKECL